MSEARDRCCCGYEPATLRCDPCGRGHHEACWDLTRPRVPSAEERERQDERLKLQYTVDLALRVAATSGTTFESAMEAITIMRNSVLPPPPSMKLILLYVALLSGFFLGFGCALIVVWGF